MADVVPSLQSKFGGPTRTQEEAIQAASICQLFSPSSRFACTIALCLALAGIIADPTTCHALSPSATLISASYAKLQVGMGLAGSLIRSITLIYHGLTVFSGNSKSVGSNSMGVRFPLPAPSNLFVCNMLQGREVSEADPPVQIRYTAHPIYFQYLTVFEVWLGRSHLYIDCPYIRSITECAADKVSALGTKLEGSYVMERTFQASWIQDTGLIAATLLD
jgi:hypothetical protein